MGSCAAIASFFLILVGALPASAEEIRLPVTRDTYFSTVGREAAGNLGGSPRLKLKSIQEMSLVDFDPSSLKGKTIRKATLHVRRVEPEILRRITVSSLAAEWVEGTGTNYEPQKGSSTFLARQHPDVPWAFPGSDLTAVMLGQGGTVWHSADASPPDAAGWQEIPVDPAVVAARVAGISFGFIVFDDTGSEWTRNGEKFTMRLFPNRYIYSRDQNAQVAPYFTIETGPEDREPPAAPTSFASDTKDLPAGEAKVSWLTPNDAGPAGTIGFFAEIDGKPLPRYLIPAAGKVGSRVSLRLRDLNLRPGQTVKLAVRAVDRAGNLSSPALFNVTVSDQKINPLPGRNGEPFTQVRPLPRLGEAEIAIVDELDKVQPITGRMIPPQEPGYLSANHLWDTTQIRLDGAKNERVAFQILVKGKVHDLRPSVRFSDGSKPTLTFYRFRYVQSKNGPVPDPLLPLEGGLDLPDATAKFAGQKYGSVICEFYVPHDAAAGKHLGTLTLSAEGHELKVPITMNVWNFSLPDRLSFLPELNCYGLPGNEMDYYRLAHQNRTMLNRVPYSQTGIIEDGCGPAWDAKSQKLDFAAWDKRFGPLFDGSAFADLPGRNVPIEGFYLPLNENWPTPIEGNYNGSYWADEAFPPAYKKAFVSASRQFAEHINQRRWNQTLFQGFFNGKNNFKERGWSRGSSPWLLDEPANFQDYAALHFFGRLFHEGVDPVKGNARLLFRCDISRPEWQRDLMDDVLNYNVVGGGAFHQYRRIVMDRKQRFGQVVIPYGTTNDPADSNLQPVGWCLDSWTLGGDGVLPWQVIGNADAWKNAQDTCLFYPGESIGRKGPLPSIRLKAYLRGEQDVEYLTLLAKQEKQTQLIFGERVRAALPMQAHRGASSFTGGEDAGVMTFNNLKPQDVWALRVRIAQLLSEH
jgi:hypothetical protein